MKLFLPFVSIVVVVSAASRTSSDHKERKEHFRAMADIIRSVKCLKSSLSSKIYVPEVITTKSCRHENFCKAARLLSAYTAESLKLRTREWVLPGKLAKYTKDVNCMDHSSANEIELTQLLENIQICAQKTINRRT